VDVFGFPPTQQALDDPPGLLAMGGDLSPQRLLHAYSLGIFPWYSDGEPILWWTPDPRCVLVPNQIRVSKSLKKRLRKPYTVTINRAFAQVMLRCATVDGRVDNTWISQEMHQAYNELHRLGYAHSIEVWLDAELIGGLYGLRLGRVFFGESMFSRATDGSKIALTALAVLCSKAGIELIDCQVENPHLMSMGASLLPRLDFERILGENVHADIDHRCWRLEERTKELL
jgi:leucyl/phenylalanyl-tRNA--protein transferase